MSSAGQYKTIDDVISDLNVMITEAPLPHKEKCQLADIVGQLEQITKPHREILTEKGDSIALHHDD
tara:strand:+ start:221 stop:418 length:198 start_codon:yes stop_codon:yes gene_type:complete